MILAASAVLASLAGALIIGVGGSPEPKSRRPSSWISTALELSSHPLFRPWVDRFVQRLQDNPGLAEGMARAALAIDTTSRQGLSEPGQLFRLTFPHTANGQLSGVVIKSSVILINNGGANAQGTILFRRNDGNPMTVNTNLGTSSRFDFSLESGEVLRVETDGSGSAVTGWIEVESDVELSGSGVFTTSTTGGQFLSEVGIGDSVRAQSLMVFVDTTGGKNTGVGICNPNAVATANLTYQLRRLDGTLVTEKADSLGALTQEAEFVSDTFPGSEAEGFKGVLVIISDIPVAVVTLRTRGVNFTSLPAVPGAEGNGGDEQPLYFARIGDGVFGNLGFQTSFVLMNNSDSPVTANLEMFDEDGGDLALEIDSTRTNRLQVELPARGGVELTTAGTTSPGVIGWAQVSSSQPVAGGATFTITNRDTGAFVAEVGVPDSPLTSRPEIFVREQGQISTGLALSNPSNVAVTLRMRLVGEPASAAAVHKAGVAIPPVVASTTLELAPLSHVGLFTPQLFPNVVEVKNRNFEGRVELEAFDSALGDEFLVPLTGITLLARGAQLSSLPLAEYKVNFGPRVWFRPGTLLAGASPAFCLELRQSAQELPMRRAVITISQGRIDFSKVLEAERAGHMLGEAFFGLGVLAGTNFAFDVAGETASFFSPVTFDGQSEWVPVIGRLSNLAQGGVEFVLESNSANIAPLIFPMTNQVCFDSELLELPEQAGATIRVSQEFESQERTLGENDFLNSSSFSVAVLEDLEQAAPRIDSVTPSRVAAGQEIEILGSGFSGLSETGIRVGGKAGEATILESGENRLRIRLPPEIGNGELRLENQGRTSNAYLLDVAFAPVADVNFGSLVAGAASTLAVEVTQQQDEISLAELILSIQGGGAEWITNGFSPGSSLGTLEFLGEPYNLVVNSSDTSLLSVEAVDEDETTLFTLEISNDRQDSFVLRLLPMPTISLPTEGRTLLELTVPIFRMPMQSGESFAMDLRFRSQPERNLIAATALNSEATKTVETQ